jgi:glycosyltransferase involved in cell wall biosynthesis
VPILRQTHLLVIASKAESFCMAALEAMACGIPVLATNVGGLSELVLHGKTGFLFPPGNHGSAVNLAVELLSNADFYENMSQAATDHAQKFSKEKIVSAYEDFYRRLLYKNCPSKW